jgi:hypothetical protein
LVFKKYRPLEIMVLLIRFCMLGTAQFNAKPGIRAEKIQNIGWEGVLTAAASKMKPKAFFCFGGVFMEISRKGKNALTPALSRRAREVWWLACF